MQTIFFISCSQGHGKNMFSDLLFFDYGIYMRFNMYGEELKIYVFTLLK